MIRFGRVRLGLLALLASVLVATVLAGTAGAGSNYVCSGVGQSIPPGSYGSVTVTGLCSIEGVVNISGGLTIASGAGLDASGPDCNSFVNVSGGGVDVMDGGVLFLGNGAGTGCPNSNDVVSGGLRASNPLAVVVHGTTFNGGFIVSGGGGGTSCGPAVVQGVPLPFPPFTDVEDSRINGGLICSANALAFPGPGGVPTNSFDGSPPNPNKVNGQESGQCAGL
jgi:hypothetical protein